MSQLYGEKITLARLYEVIMSERDRTDGRLERFEGRMDRVDDNMKTVMRQVSEVHTMVAGFPCIRHTEEIADLKAGRGSVITVSLGDVSKAVKVGAGVVAAIGVVLTAARDQVGHIIAAWAAGGTRTP